MTERQTEIDISERYPYEGPRTPNPDEWRGTTELIRSIFFKSAPSYLEAVKEWPMSLRPEAIDNIFVMFHRGQPVSAIARLCRDIMVSGHALRMGFVGGVCTHPDHRGKGLAGTVLDATLQRFADDGVDFVYISGARPLYYRTGANHIGGFPVFFLTADVQESVNTGDLNIRQATLADAKILHSLNEGEETRFIRDMLDYELVIQHGYCSGGLCIFNIVESGSAPVAYVAVRNPERNKERWSQKVIEFAGDRAAILYTLMDIANKNGSNGHLIIEVYTGDELANRLSAMGVKSRDGRIGGTVKLLNFTHTMEKLRPYFAEKLDSSFAESLEFTAGKGRYVAAGDGGILEIDGETNMLWTLLGSPPGGQIENVRSKGLMERAMEICLPIPIPALHLNTI